MTVRRLRFCWLCKCCREEGDFQWNDFREGIQWKAEPKTPQEHLDHPPCNHPYMRIKGFSAHTYRLDVCHISDVHGVMGHLAGNVLKELVYDQLPSTPAINLRTVYNRIEELYKDFGIVDRVTNLTLNMFVDPKGVSTSYPNLSAKAAETKHLNKVLLQLCVENHRGTEHDDHRLAACQGMCHFYAATQTAAPHLQDSEVALMKRGINMFLSHYQWLSAEAFGNNTFQYNVVPKFHFFYHLGEQGEFENPRLSSCYKMEDFIGKICAMAHACCCGTKTHAIPWKVGEKYICLIHLRLTLDCFQD